MAAVEGAGAGGFGAVVGAVVGVFFCVGAVAARAHVSLCKEKWMMKGPKGVRKESANGVTYETMLVNAGRSEGLRTKTYT